MEIFELIEDYLIDQDDGLKLLTWFLNLVMQLEALLPGRARWEACGSSSLDGDLF